MKKLIILSGLFVIVLIIFIVSSLLFAGQSRTPVVRPTPLATRVQTLPLNIISTDPVSGHSDVSPTKELVVVFNKPIDENDVVVALAPETLHSMRIEGTRLFIKPTTLWLAGMPYRCTIKYKDANILPQSFTFTTIGPTPETFPDTRPPEEEIRKEEEFNRLNYPDVYLSNETPYESESFTIESDFTNEPTGHFYFTITLKGNNSDASRSKAIIWMKSFGLTDAQISSLDIRYQ